MTTTRSAGDYHYTTVKHSYRFSHQVFHVSIPYCVARGETRVESTSSRSLSSSSESISTSFDDVGDAFPKSNRFEASTSGSNESCSTSSSRESANDGNSLSPSSSGGGEVEIVDDDSDCGVGQRPVFVQLWLACVGSFFTGPLTDMVTGSSGGVGSWSLMDTGIGVSVKLPGSEFCRAASILVWVLPPSGRDVRRL